MPRFEAGFGSAIITPPTPVQLAGFIDDQPATEVRDDLEVRALFMRGEHGAVCLLVCDLLGMSRGFARPIREAVGIPITAKLGGEGDVLGAVAGAVDAGADAVCLAGRFPAFLPDVRTRLPLLGTFGAIGGAWALPIAARWIAKARARFGPDLALIGTNGARDGLDVARFLLSGARAVQMTSAVITDGPVALTRTIAGLEAYLDEQGLTAEALVGEAADLVRSYEEVER